MLDKRAALASIAIIVLASLSAGAGTMAMFNDVETSEGNTLGAATMDLKIDGGDSAVQMFEVSNISPGDSGCQMVTLTRTGTEDISMLRMKVSITSLVDKDGASTEPEVEAGDTTTNQDEEGELADNLYLEIGEDTAGDGVMDNVLWEGYADELPLDPDAICDTLNNWVFEKDETKRFMICWSVDQSVGNIIQGDVVEFDIKFDLAVFH
ncbi:MAG: TasA family protein [Thermoproteota archaeon]